MGRRAVVPVGGPDVPGALGVELPEGLIAAVRASRAAISVSVRPDSSATAARRRSASPSSWAPRNTRRTCTPRSSKPRAVATARAVPEEWPHSRMSGQPPAGDLLHDLLHDLRRPARTARAPAARSCPGSSTAYTAIPRRRRARAIGSKFTAFPPAYGKQINALAGTPSGSASTCNARLATPSPTASALGPTVDQRGQVGQHGVARDVLERDRLLQRDGQLHRRQRRTAAVEEVVEAADLVLGDPEDARVGGRDPLLGRRARRIPRLRRRPRARWRAPSTPSRRSCRWRSAAAFPPVERHRHHVVRQRPAQPLPQHLDLDRPRRRRRRPPGTCRGRAARPPPRRRRRRRAPAAARCRSPRSRSGTREILTCESRRPRNSSLPSGSQRP